MKGIDGERGFTFLEALLAIAILGFMIQVVYTIYEANFRVWLAADARAEVRENTSRGIERMTRDLREALRITVGAANRITFWGKDSDEDGNCDAGEMVSYSWSGVPGEDLYRTAGSKFKLADNVENFQLEYRDGNSNLLPSPVKKASDIRHISITLTIEEKKENMVLRSSIRPRNL